MEFEKMQTEAMKLAKAMIQIAAILEPLATEYKKAIQRKKERQILKQKKYTLGLTFLESNRLENT